MVPLYAIRHKPTGEFLPEPRGRMGRGGSHVEPLPAGDGFPNPRLFVTYRGARNCLVAWLRGKHHMEYDYEDEGPYTMPYKVETGVVWTPVPHRKKEEMEIVAFMLTEIPLDPHQR